MKANGLMAIALLFSGAAFAQQASVKTTTNVNSQASAGNTSLGAGSTTSSSSAVIVNSGNNTTAGSNDAQISSAGSASITSVESAGNITAHQATGAAIAVENTVGNTLQTAGTAGLKLENKVSNTIKPATGINSTLNHTLNIQSAPIRINTRIGGGAALGIL